MKVVFCPSKFKRVRCRRDGVCEVVRGADLRSHVADICPVREEALDLALNG